MSVRIRLNRGDTLIIDERDYLSINKYSWTSNNGYVFRTKFDNGSAKRIYIHRHLTKAPDGMVVDHINGNPLDNRRSNLRVCTHKENSRNRKKPNSGLLSKFKGVRPRENGFEANVSTEGKTYYVGTFSSEIEAAIAYNQKATKLFGEYAMLNEIPKEYLNVIPKPIRHTSKYRGVLFHKRTKKWQASIQRNKKRTHLGYFDVEEEAAKAYNKKAVELYSERAKLNQV